MSATKNINAEKIQGSLTADTINIQTLGSGTSVTNLGIDSSGNVVTGTTGGGGDNFYVTGFTYNDSNTFTISQNGGLGDLTSTINTMTGLTVNGTLVVDTISATTINGSVSGLTLNDLDDVTSNIPTTPDNTYQGRLLYFDVADNQWVTGEEYVSTGNVTIWGKKGTAGTIDKGCPVYITGFDNDIHEVELANATTASTMPVIGFTGEDFDNAGVYPLITFGKLVGVDTTSTVSTINPNGETWAVNDVLYMNTTDGGLTKFRPTGSDTRIQRIAKVLKVGATDGQLFIFNTARTAGLPNLTTDYLWLGNGNDTPQEVIRTDVGITTTGFTYNDNNTFTITDDNGGSFSSTINQMSGLTINGDLDVTGDSTLNTLTATSITSNSAINVFNGHINLRDNSYFLQGRTGADVNVSLIGVDNQDRVFVGNAGYDTYIDSDTIVDGSLTATTLNITTIGGGTPVGNLGFDSNGQVVTGTTAGGDSNSTVENFYYSISNSVDTRPIFEDTNVLFNWDETGNDLEFRMKVAPGGSGDMRSLAYLVGGSTQNTFITTTGVNYDVYTAGVSSGNRLEVFITAENDVTYPAYHVIVYNTGESVENTVWIQRITRN